ncbi:hypothetical protein CI109_106166 [Kwoniella shandongensis]|uniref:Uncharacterized protein n=1 Tax=Kwoniella shandongensis TaxID=1734106 RepID=A0A5M6BYM1_9TREE|nr:uncharacterized protein CI109_003774 [Kwoniella shandongensis]KAA5527803.1 hypothetical protein CI109_003774 [Kwoniella shandongensis]
MVRTVREPNLTTPSILRVSTSSATSSRRSSGGSPSQPIFTKNATKSRIPTSSQSSGTKKRAVLGERTENIMTSHSQSSTSKTKSKQTPKSRAFNYYSPNKSLNSLSRFIAKSPQTLPLSQTAYIPSSSPASSPNTTMTSAPGATPYRPRHSMTMNMNALINEDDTLLLNMRPPEMSFTSPGFELTDASDDETPDPRVRGGLMTPANSQEVQSGSPRRSQTAKRTTALAGPSSSLRNPVSRLPTPPSSQSDEMASFSGASLALNDSFRASRIRARPSNTPPRRVSTEPSAVLGDITAEWDTPLRLGEDPSPNPRRKKSPRLDELSGEGGTLAPLRLRSPFETRDRVEVVIPVRVKGLGTPKAAATPSTVKGKGQGRASTSRTPSATLSQSTSSNSSNRRSSAGSRRSSGGSQRNTVKATPAQTRTRAVPSTAPAKSRRRSTITPSALSRSQTQTPKPASARSRRASTTATARTPRSQPRKSVTPLLQALSGRKIGFLPKPIHGSPGDDPLLLRGLDDVQPGEEVRDGMGLGLDVDQEVTQPVASSSRIRTSSVGPSQTVSSRPMIDSQPSPTMPTFSRNDDDLTLLPIGDASEGFYDTGPAWSDDGSDDEGVGEDTFVHVIQRRNMSSMIASTMEETVMEENENEVEQEAEEEQLEREASPFLPSRQDIDAREELEEDLGDVTQEGEIGTWDLSTDSVEAPNVENVDDYESLVIDPGSQISNEFGDERRDHEAAATSPESEIVHPEPIDAVVRPSSPVIADVSLDENVYDVNTQSEETETTIEEIQDNQLPSSSPLHAPVEESRPDTVEDVLVIGPEEAEPSHEDAQSEQNDSIKESRESLHDSISARSPLPAQTEQETQIAPSPPQQDISLLRSPTPISRFDRHSSMPRTPFVLIKHHEEVPPTPVPTWSASEQYAYPTLNIYSAVQATSPKHAAGSTFEARENLLEEADRVLEQLSTPVLQLAPTVELPQVEGTATMSDRVESPAVQDSHESDDPSLPAEEPEICEQRTEIIEENPAGITGHQESAVEDDGQSEDEDEGETTEEQAADLPTVSRARSVSLPFTEEGDDEGSHVGDITADADSEAWNLSSGDVSGHVEDENEEADEEGSQRSTEADHREELAESEEEDEQDESGLYDGQSSVEQPELHEGQESPELEQQTDEVDQAAHSSPPVEIPEKIILRLVERGIIKIEPDTEDSEYCSASESPENVPGSPIHRSTGVAIDPVVETSAPRSPAQALEVNRPATPAPAAHTASNSPTSTTPLHSPNATTARPLQATPIEESASTPASGASGSTLPTSTSEGISVLERMLQHRPAGSSKLSQQFIPDSPSESEQQSSSPFIEGSVVSSPAVKDSGLETEAEAEADRSVVVRKPRRSLHDELAAVTTDDSDDEVGNDSFRSVVEVSSLDPKAAARAAAILKLNHAYIEHGVLSSSKSAIGTPSHRRRKSASAMTSRHIDKQELLHEAELEIVSQRRSRSRSMSRARSMSVFSFATDDYPIPGAYVRTPQSSGKRKRTMALPAATHEEVDKTVVAEKGKSWGVPEWKKLEKVYRKEKEQWTKEREVKSLPGGLVAWARRSTFGASSSPSTATEWDPERVVKTFLQQEGEGWDREMILLRVQAIERRVNRIKEKQTISTVSPSAQGHLDTPKKRTRHNQPDETFEGNSTILQTPKATSTSAGGAGVEPPSTIRRMLGYVWGGGKKQRAGRGLLCDLQGVMTPKAADNMKEVNAGVPSSGKVVLPPPPPGRRVEGSIPHPTSNAWTVPAPVAPPITTRPTSSTTNPRYSLPAPSSSLLSSSSSWPTFSSLTPGPSTKGGRLYPPLEPSMTQRSSAIAKLFPESQHAHSSETAATPAQARAMSMEQRKRGESVKDMVMNFEGKRV